MPTIPLKVTRMPIGDGTGTASAAKPPLFRGNGDTDYVCGHCGVVIAAGMAANQHVIIDSAVCSACGAKNEFPLELRA
jgi:hypothetical protein